MNSVLLVRKEHLDKILFGCKTIEIRGSPCKSKIGKRIGFAYCGQKEKSSQRFIIGTAVISGYKQYHSIEEFKNDEKFHCSSCSSLPYKKTFGWILNDITFLENPVEFEYKKGAIIWVNV